MAPASFYNLPFMPETVLQGELTAFRLPVLLSLLSNTRKRGTLVLTGEDRESHVYFDDGALVFATSNQPAFRLGSILLRKKKITAEQMTRIEELMARDGARFGELAVQDNVVTAEQLRDFLKVQVSEIVFDAFAWSHGSFAFSPELTLPSYAVTIAIDLPNLIMEGARRIEAWEQCLRLLPDKNVVFRVVAAPRDEKVTLTAEEWMILFLINGQKTLEELSAEADDPLRVYRVVYGLYSNKLIETVIRTTPVDDETVAPQTSLPGIEGGDATIRQGAPRFGSESTVQDEPAGDDTSLLISTEGRLSYADVIRPTVAQLRYATGELTGKTIPLTELEYLVGRHRDNNIMVPDLGVSGFHARIYRGPDGYIVEDLKSRNGTFVNGARVFHSSLDDGDRLHVGQTDLLYEVLFATDTGTNEELNER